MSYQTTNPHGARTLLEGDDGWVYLDVRTVEEFRAGHVPGAYNVPLLELGLGGMRPNGGFLEVIARHFTKEARLVVGCKVGGRSMRACELLAAHGYENLVNMDGGFSGRHAETGELVEEGWSGCGFPTATEPQPGRAYDALR